MNVSLSFEMILRLFPPVSEAFLAREPEKNTCNLDNSQGFFPAEIERKSPKICAINIRLPVDQRALCDVPLMLYLALLFYQ